MTVFDENCLYVIKCLALVFVAAPFIMLCGAAVTCICVYIGRRLADTLRLHRMALPRCGKCKFYGTVQCPLYFKACPDDFCSRGERWDT